MEIPDCYDPIYQAETREAEADRNALHCEDCGKVLFGDSPVFNWDGDRLCEDCCRTAIEANFSILEIANALKIPARYAADTEAGCGY